MKKLLTSIALGIMLAGNLYAKAPIENYVLSLPKQSLSQEEISDLIHMREEEKLARDVYLTLYNKWKLPIFRNISKSESWHMHMIKLLLNKYGLKDPVVSDKIGVFEDPHLQVLYNKLVSQGSRSLIDALKVGATIEDLDIKDLEEAINRTDNQDIRMVYQNLEKGSRNHLRAFIAVLKRYGGSYTPKYISQSYFEEIINSGIERGFRRWKIILKISYFLYVRFFMMIVIN